MTKLDAGLITPLPASDSGSAAVWGSKRINSRPQSCLSLTWSGYPSNDDDDDDRKDHQKDRKAIRSWLYRKGEKVLLVKKGDQSGIEKKKKVHLIGQRQPIRSERERALMNEY